VVPAFRRLMLFLGNVFLDVIERQFPPQRSESCLQTKNTLVVSPDNRSRKEINERIHTELQWGGLVSNQEHHIRTLVPRQNLTGADRTWAQRYEVSDVLRYARTSSRRPALGKASTRT
jgi:hypothetical protein